MKIEELFERDDVFAASGYGELRKKLIAAIAQSTHDYEKLKEPNYIMAQAKSHLSRPPFSDWSESAQRRMLGDIMDEFAIMPPDRNTAVFKRY